MKRRRESSTEEWSSSSDDDEPDVRCRVDKTWSCIQPKVTQISHIWTIYRYRICTRFYGNEEGAVGYVDLRSPRFLTSINGSTSKWYLELEVKEEDCDNSDDDSSGEDVYIPLNLCLESSDERRVNAKFSLSVLDEKLEQLTSPRTIFCQFNARRRFQYSHGFRDFLKKNDLFKSGGLLRDDCLRIKCELTVAENKISWFSSRMNEVHTIQELKLGNQLKSLFDRKVMSDIILCAGDKEFSAHKAILAARSPVFAAMFEHDMTEARQNKVTIKDIKPDVLQEILAFVYTDESPNLNKAMAEDLLVAADKYDIMRLKGMCEEVLGAEVTMNNAVEMLSLADLGNSKMLEDQVTAFINYRSTDLMNTGAWKKMLMTNRNLLSKAIEEASKLKVDSTSEPSNQ